MKTRLLWRAAAALMLVLFALPLASCGSGLFPTRLNVTFTGEIVEQPLIDGERLTQVIVRDISPLVRAVADGEAPRLNIVLEPGETYGAWLEAPKDMFEHVSAVVRGGTLIVSGDKDINYDFPRATLRITAPSLAYLELNGIVDLYSAAPFVSDKTEVVCNGVSAFDAAWDVRELTLTLNGTVSGQAYGTAQRLNIKLNGAGDLDAAGLIGRDVTVTINGAGKVAVGAEKNLNAVINGAGDVVYYGAPKVVQRIAGLGRVTAGE